jgi:hypothetical protein
MANRRKQSPGRDKMLVERKHPPITDVPSGTKYAENIAYLTALLTLPENQFSTNILSLPKKSIYLQFFPNLCD